LQVLAEHGAGLLVVGYFVLSVSSIHNTCYDGNLRSITSHTLDETQNADMTMLQQLEWMPNFLRWPDK
jgi:hypothetical protein